MISADILLGLLVLLGVLLVIQDCVYLEVDVRVFCLFLVVLFLLVDSIFIRTVTLILFLSVILSYKTVKIVDLSVLFLMFLLVFTFFDYLNIFILGLVICEIIYLVRTKEKVVPFMLIGLVNIVGMCVVRYI